ncbi:MAG: hypothetical protein A3A82_00655 [Candidatus Pacebacteria bacterium RIFCSPLOWO2_01_FULL_47_12]|nr:MAG: hypothetical protein A3A82_00655 [Candidatus Pacebacteria bacterium RIFCSPLOWO2_01_FULL_47_12]
MIKIFLRTHSEKFLLVLLCLVIAFAAYYLGMLQGRKGFLPMLAEVREQKNQCVAEIESLDEEFDRCITDRAMVVGESTHTYSFKDFGLYSPLFFGREVITTVYDYKREQTLHKSIMLDDGIYISVWEPQDDGYSLNETEIDFPIFEPSEFGFYFPIAISSQKSKWDMKNGYKSKYGLTFYPNTSHYSFLMRTALDAVSLEVINTLSQRGRPTYLSILVPVNPSMKILEASDTEILDGIKVAKEVADTISYKVEAQNNVGE